VEMHEGIFNHFYKCVVKNTAVNRELFFWKVKSWNAFVKRN